MQSGELDLLLYRLRDLATRYRGEGISELDTRNALVEPVLDALGWPESELSLVRSDYRSSPESPPADYALLLEGEPLVLIAAEALDTPLDDPEVEARFRSLLGGSAVPWLLLTNGRDWRLYARDRGDPSRADPVFSTSIEAEDCADWLGWLERDMVEGGELERAWTALSAARLVARELDFAIRLRSDELVDWLAQQTGLPALEVREGLEFLRLRVEVVGAEGLPDRLDAEPLLALPPGGAAPGHLHTWAETDPPANGNGATPQDALHAPSPSAPSPGRSASGSHGAEPDGLASHPAHRSPRWWSGRPADGSGPLPLPDFHTKPNRYRVGDLQWRVRSWKEVIVCTALAIHQLRPELYERLFIGELWGKRRPWFSREEDELRVPLPVPGGYVETNLSSRDTIKRVNRLLAWSGLDQLDVGYEATSRGVEPE